MLFFFITFILLSNSHAFIYKNKIIIYIDKDILTLMEFNSRIKLLETIKRVRINKFQKNQVLTSFVEEKLFLTNINNRHALKFNTILYFKTFLEYYGFLDKKQFFTLFRLNEKEFYCYLKFKILSHKLLKYFPLSVYDFNTGYFVNNVSNILLFIDKSNVKKLTDFINIKLSLSHTLINSYDALSITSSVYKRKIFFIHCNYQRYQYKRILYPIYVNKILTIFARSSPMYYYS